MKMLLDYFKSPHYIKTTRINWRVFFISGLFLYMICIPYSFINDLLLHSISVNYIELDPSKIVVFFAVIVGAPLLEEPLFRLVLKPTANSFIVILIFFGLTVISCLAEKLFVVSAVSLVLFCFILILVSNKNYFRKTQIWLLKHFRGFFYTSCVLFGIVHITNYEPFSYKLFLILPVFSIPYIIAGMFFGFIRMKFGLAYAMLYHSLFNLLPAVIMLFSK
jgi:hypothetical protein